MPGTPRAIHKSLLRRVAWCAAAMAVSTSWLSAQPLDVSGEEVAGAVQKGVANIVRQQQVGLNRGTWIDLGHKGGTTALMALALLNSGTPANDPVVINALDALDGVPNQSVYVVALKCQVYAAHAAASGNPRAYKTQLTLAASWLVKAQLDNGMWCYSTGRGGRGDNSNTQFALLGLHEASKAGFAVPPEVWQKAAKHFQNTQLPDGGWGYNYTEARRGSGYGSMTAAGLASLYICGLRLNVGGKHVFVNGGYPDCGKYQQNLAIASGLDWMGRKFTVTENPNRGSWLHYYLYAMERVGMITGLRNFGTHDWYREGAAYLVRTQRADGGFGDSVVDTAFGVLFLAKGNRPVIIQKLQWNDVKNPEEWNRNIHDLENLTAFIGDKFGKTTTWQTATLNLPLTELRRSPVLFITGHTFPQFTDAEKDKLRQFVESGGTILAEACCGSAEFAAGFRKFIAELFENKYRLAPLAKDHPVFGSYFPLADTYDLEGVDVGCRTGVFFSPRALSCLWELQDIPQWSEKALQIGVNIAAYATGREQLKNKLEAVELPMAAKAAGQPTEIPRGAVRLATLVHDGDCKADLNAMANLAEMLRDKAKIDVVSQGRYLQADDEKIFEYPVLFMTGHYTFKLSDKEVASLRLYLKRGGFLVADACCGRKAFDVSFRQLMKQVFPDQDLKPLPADHPVYTGQAGAALGEVKYRKVLQEELQKDGEVNWRGTTRPSLEAITLDGRAAVLYSRYDWSCALEGDKPYSCRGYVDEDGKRLALNLFLFAISY